MKDSFYSSFENKHRGSRELVKERLHAYMPFIGPLKTIHPGQTILDLGCGRGEWLEMMQALGFNSKGVDLDEGMLSYCHDLGLNVEKSDVISFLESMHDKSVVIVSSFHLVEHLGFDNVKRLVEESFRILKQGGLLIMETPNPENIIVSTNNFYIDPTHISPIPSALLSFLVEYKGFKRHKILYLQENTNLSSKEDIQIIDVLGGVSPDYSVIAQKQGELATLNMLDTAFSVNYGVGLKELSTKYHLKINQLLTVRDEKIANLDNSIERLNLMVHKENAELKANLSDVYASTSWRITAALRAISRWTQLCVKLIKTNDITSYPLRFKIYLVKVFCVFIRQCIKSLNRKEKLKQLILKFIKKIGCYHYINKALDILNRPLVTDNLKKKK
ncbi:class I SAM-dependent methyltransferase [Candidatus Gillettellia adelgis]